MKNAVRIVAITGLASALAATGASAQSVVFDGRDTANDVIVEIEKDIREDGNRDLPTRGVVGRPLGWTGSVSARASMSEGNSDNVDVGIGARIGYSDGVNAHRFDLAYSYSEDDDVTTEKDILAGYDFTREFGNGAYAFGKLDYVYDEFASYQKDAFIGLGIGFRVMENAQTQWSLQIGPGYREARDANDNVVIDDVAVSAASYFRTQLSDTAFVTNDTDVLWAEDNTRVTNDLGLNVAMTNALALRASILTKYDTDPLPGYDDTDNTFGLSLVYSFN